MPDESIPHSVVAKDIDGGFHEIATSQLRWRPSAYGVVLQDNAVLAVPTRSGKWDLPGGGIEFGEMPEAALLREVYEETGLKVAEPRLLHVASSFFKMPDKAEDFIQSILLYYTLRVSGGELSAIGFDEFERMHLRQAEWLPLRELDGIELTSSVDWRPIVRTAAEL